MLTYSISMLDITITYKLYLKNSFFLNKFYKFVVVVVVVFVVVFVLGHISLIH
jgi:hypothetical protein